MSFLLISLHLTQIILTVFCEVYSEYAVYFWAVGLPLIMIFTFPFYCVSMDYVCEITYPVGEFYSGAFVLNGAMIWAILQTYLARYFLDTLKQRIWVNITSSFFIFIALITFLLVDEDLRRNNVENDEPMKNSQFENNEECDKIIDDDQQKYNKEEL